jgi:hypothetical protein
MTTIHGFTQITIGEHEFARFLRREKAIDNWYSVGNAVNWYGPDGVVVAQCQYDNAAPSCTYWVREDLTKGMEVTSNGTS